MKKKRYVRAEQKLINIAVDSVLFTNSSSVGGASATPEPDDPNAGNLLFGFGSIFANYTTAEPVIC